MPPRRRLVGAIARRKYVWVPARVTFTVPANSHANSADLLANFFTSYGRDTGPGLTITRIRGHAILTNQLAATGSQSINSGIEVVAGAMVPVQNLGINMVDAIWRLDTYTGARAQEYAAGAFRSVGDIYVVDSKAQRKVEGVGGEMIWRVSNGPGGAVDVAMSIVTLLRLP